MAMTLASRRAGRLGVLAFGLALALVPAVVLAQDNSMPQPAAVGAGAAPTGFASSVGNTAWVYTGPFASTTPAMTTGSITMNVMSASAVGMPASQDTGNVMATFNYPANGPQYTVRFTSLRPLDNAPAVGFMKSVCGAMGAGGPALPRTLVYMYVSGLADITRNGETIATGQPAMAFVTQGLHSTDQSPTWLTAANVETQEIGLVVPGPLASGGSAVPGFPNGYFYVYWPQAAFNLNNVGGTVTTTTETTTTRTTVTGRGPIAPTGTHNLTITLTNTGIQTTSDRAPGFYIVTVRNSSSTCRGIVMQGIDRCCAPYTRFTSGLAPGTSRSFGWFFPPGPVTVRDILNADKTIRSYTDVQLGGHSETITFNNY